MSNSDYKSTDALMRHLRKNNISISGSLQKQQLINTGYFHGYKGYRFFGKSHNRLPFVSQIEKIISFGETLNIQKWLIYAVFYSSRVLESAQLVTD